MGLRLSLVPVFKGLTYNIFRLNSPRIGSANYGRRGLRIGTEGGWGLPRVLVQHDTLRNGGGLFPFIITARVLARGRRSRMARVRSAILANRYVYCRFFGTVFLLRH